MNLRLFVAFALFHSACAHREGVLPFREKLPRAEAACRNGHGEWCRWAAVAYLNDLSGVRNDATAVALLEAGCAAKHHDSCVDLAVMKHHGIGTAADATGALALLQTSCEAKHAASCQYRTQLTAAAAERTESCPSHPAAPDTEGGLAKASIYATIQTAVPAVRQCYERALWNDAAPEGKLTTAFMIQNDGAVANAEISEDTLRAPKVNACILSVFSKLKFACPEGPGSVHVDYPFVFKAPRD